MTTDTFIPSAENISTALLRQLRATSAARLEEVQAEIDNLLNELDAVDSNQPTSEFMRAIGPIRDRLNSCYGEKKALRLALGLA